MNSKNPEVSIIIPVHNRIEELKRAINSIAAQTYRNFEIIIIDDLSDEPIEITSNDSHDDLHIKIIRLPKKGNANIARNKGIEESNGNYVAFLESDDEWKDTVDRNLMSYIWTSRAAVPYLRKSNAGRVLNVSGLSGTQLLAGSWSTTITNAGIHGMTKLLASELAPDNITVNAIAPGTVKTEAWMGPRADAVAKARGISSDEVRAIMAANAMLDRLAEPEEIGDVATFLVSVKNSYMTGTVVEVCGGWGKYIG